MPAETLQGCSQVGILNGFCNGLDEFGIIRGKALGAAYGMLFWLIANQDAHFNFLNRESFVPEFDTEITRKIT